MKNQLFNMINQYIISYMVAAAIINLIYVCVIKVIRKILNHKHHKIMKLSIVASVLFIAYTILCIFSTDLAVALSEPTNYLLAILEFVKIFYPILLACISMYTVFKIKD